MLEWLKRLFPSSQAPKKSGVWIGPGKYAKTLATEPGDLAKHVLILGTTRRGSGLMQAQEPTAEEMERARKHEQAEHERVNKRLNAVREAYWQTSAEGDFYSLHDALVSTVMKGSRISPTQHHIKALFMMLPASIIGQGVAWGFGDTEVGDDIYSFVEKNQSAVIKQLGLPTA